MKMQMHEKSDEYKIPVKTGKSQLKEVQNANAFGRRRKRMRRRRRGKRRFRML